MIIVDAHLDLSWNAANGRDVARPASEQPTLRQGGPDLVATVGLPDLRRGGVGLICGTIFCQPGGVDHPGYETADEAAAQAEQQWAWYEGQMATGNLRLVRCEADLPASDCGIEDSTALSSSRKTQSAIPLILLLEGADAIRDEADLRRWFDRGLRIVGLAWKRTRHAGGTSQPGPLTDEGRRLLARLDALGIIHDTSHLAEESFWELLERASGPVIASHSNCRSIVPGDRHLSDEMIKAIAARDGMIGINFYDRFLLPPDQFGDRRVTLADVVRHIRHACDLIGDARHVGIGTDMDGGLGRAQIPVEIATSADLPMLADALIAAGFAEDAVRGIMGGNWLEFFRRALPVRRAAVHQLA